MRSLSIIGLIPLLCWACSRSPEPRPVSAQDMAAHERLAAETQAELTAQRRQPVPQSATKAPIVPQNTEVLTIIACLDECEHLIDELFAIDAGAVYLEATRRYQALPSTAPAKGAIQQRLLELGKRLEDLRRHLSASATQPALKGE
jgi:hypothetical protein